MRFINPKIIADDILDDAITLAKMAPGTDGNIITYDASGNPAVVSTGSASQVLTSAGAGSPPTFAAAAAGGKLLKAGVIPYATLTTSSSSTGTDAATLSELSFTPTASASTIFVIGLLGFSDPISGGSRKESQCYISNEIGGSQNLIASSKGHGANRYNEDSTVYRVHGSACIGGSFNAAQTSAYNIALRVNGRDILGSGSSTEWLGIGFIYEIDI
jgi:hypothetical protein